MSSHIFEVDVLFQLFQVIYELGPDLGSPVGIEVIEVQGELDAGFEGFVECADAVACEDQDALWPRSAVWDSCWRLRDFTVVVLDHAEKDCKPSAARMAHDSGCVAHRIQGRFARGWHRIAVREIRLLRQGGPLIVLAATVSKAMDGWNLPQFHRLPK